MSERQKQDDLNAAVLLETERDYILGVLKDALSEDCTMPHTCAGVGCAVCVWIEHRKTRDAEAILIERTAFYRDKMSEKSEPQTLEASRGS